MIVIFFFYIGYTVRDLKLKMSEHKEILYKSKCEYKRKIIESTLFEIIPNSNLSRGQWSPDPITSMVMGQVLPKGLAQTDRLTVPPGNVT